MDLSQNHGRLKADPLTPWCDLKPTRFHSLSPVPNAALFPARYTQPMSSRNETEIKFPIPDLPSLAAKLRDLGFVEITPRTHEMNVLFDLPGRPLLGRGEILRIRKYGDSWVLTHNVIVQTNDKPKFPGDPYPKTPRCGALKTCQQFFPKDWKAVKFTNFVDGNGSGSDYRLAPTSPYRKAGSDGKDIGADIDAINSATQGVAP